MNSVSLTGTICLGPIYKELTDGRSGAYLRLNFESKGSIKCYATGAQANYLETFTLGNEITLHGRLVVDYKSGSFEIFIRQIEKPAARQMAGREADWKSTRDFKRMAAGGGDR